MSLALKPQTWKNISVMLSGRHQFRNNLPPLADDVTDVKYCFREAVESADDQLHLLCVGRERCLPEYHVRRGEYHCAVVEFIFEGKGKLRLGNEEHDLYPGVVFSYGLDHAHDMQADRNAPMNKYFAAYTCANWDRPDIGNFIRPGQVKFSVELSAMQVLFEELLREGRRSGNGKQLIVEKYLELILLKSANAAPAGEESQGGSVASFERTLAYIESHFAEVSSLAGLADATGLSSTYICRLFRRFGNESPHLCIMRHKLNHAAELIVRGSTSIGEVAAQVGYVDPFHFSRLFKKRFGHSPKKFREMARAQNPAKL